ncbi:lipid A deacylase LpxR family protein [Gilvimarinus polysaccharolyticus]|uniref:lipid A deacylase LpxR family protein n=1 Tax=Gilvimarinus polysaccharolyticus TaxID=863921 RepID=UPI0009FC92C2|nr:lipid A deacylase LpxR family protein [Gilvimarinus polysaccharolyticus]
MKKSNFVARLCPCHLAFALFAAGLAQTSQAQTTDWISLVWQNDLFSGRDGGGYTNGLFISLYQVAEAEAEPLVEPTLIKPLSWLLNDGYDLAFNEHSVGQVMITPADISKSTPAPHEVPYAGLLTYRASRVLVNDNIADMVRTTVGVIGPASMAEQSQKFIHKVVGSTEPKGWDYQLENEPVIAVRRARVWRYELSPMIDTVLLAQGRAGNLESAVGAGALVRFGRGLQRSFATTLLQQGRTSTPTAVEDGWYLYGGFEADYVFNNIFVNGNTYRDSPSSDLRHNQLSFTAGMSYAWDAFSVTFGYKSGTKLDIHDSSRDSFGTLSFAWKL